MRDIKWSRDEAGERLWIGKVATYRVRSLSGPWLLELHPVDGVEDDDVHEDTHDAPLVTLQECKVFIDIMETTGDPSIAYEAALLWRCTKKAR